MQSDDWMIDQLDLSNYASKFGLNELDSMLSLPGYSVLIVLIFTGVADVAGVVGVAVCTAFAAAAYATAYALSCASTADSAASCARRRRSRLLVR